MTSNEDKKARVKVILDMIEDGELDQYLIEIKEGIEERAERRKEAVLKLVRLTYGEEARIVDPGSKSGGIRPSASPEDGRPLLTGSRDPEIEMPDGTILKPDDPAKFNPAAHETTPGPVPDPMGGGDDDGQFINTGATFG